MEKSTIKKITIIISIVGLLFASSCSLFTGFLNLVGNSEPVPPPTVTPTPQPLLEVETGEALTTIQNGFSAVYTRVLPAVVNIRVVQYGVQNTAPDIWNFPFPFPFHFPFQMPDRGTPSNRSAIGSGFVWDEAGYIVTNNHVIEGADEITVTLADGTSLAGTLVGADRDSDLAVLKIEYPEGKLQPIQIADSTQVQVGQLVAAIGNPFGLQGSMTVGIISALGRSLPVSSQDSPGISFTIPDVIQVDAPINPGNSGGVLVDMDARLVGVPTAIESPSGANAGIGFVVPSVIVQNVVPKLIENGYYEHPWIGISGTTLTSDMAEEAGLPREQHGVLIVEVIPDSPAEKAGLLGSGENQVGDIIIQIDSQPTLDFEDLTTYMARHTNTGETITLTILRDGETQILDLELGIRPSSPSPRAEREQPVRSGDVWLGISGVEVTPGILQAMDLEPGLTGILIQQVILNSPADQAGLQGSSTAAEINGEQILVGGDIILTVDGHQVRDMESLNAELDKHKLGDQIILTILRGGKQIHLKVVLGENPRSSVSGQ
ncbi:MAG: hypothetical protein DRI46_11000 [Chloroflexi bacterium]|nr:MAG: hypothetical protein DRI46_11000 [Chloroflexota bacterium]